MELSFEQFIFVSSRTTTVALFFAQRVKMILDVLTLRSKCQSIDVLEVAFERGDVSFSFEE